jgi:hypothetical protein
LQNVEIIYELFVVAKDNLLAHIVQKHYAANESYGRRIIPTLENPTEIWLSGYDND